MRRSVITVSVLLLASAAVLGLPGCLGLSGRDASSGSFPPSRLETCRPRLFFRPESWPGGRSVAELRARAATEPFKDRVRLLRTTRANLALKWLISGDEAAAAEALAGLKSLRTKLGTSDEGTELVDAALAYDWLFAWKGFSAEDRRMVEDRMLSLAAGMRAYLEGEGAHVFHTRMYAWTAGVGLAGLALHDVRPEGAGLFGFARRYYEERLLPARAIQDGAMHNGLSYGPNYMMFPLLQFLEGAKSAANVDYFHTARAADSDWLRATAPFLTYAVRPDFRHVLYGDVATTDPAKHFRFMLDILAAEYRDGYAAELARRISERFKTSGYHAEWIYLFFAFHDPEVAPRSLEELPVFRVFSPHGVGHAFWRSDWSESATLVHFRCGDYFEDHGHFDQGSFTIFRKGGLALKGGGYWGFDTDHRHHYYKQAVSANTVIFSDPADPADEGRQRQMHYQSAGTVADYLAHKEPGAEPCVETGEILAVDDPAWASGTGAGFHSVVADVTAAWDQAKVRRFVRRLAFVGGRHLVVVDETETVRPEIRARWLLHAPVEPKPVAAAAVAAGAAATGAGQPSVWEVRTPESVLYVRPLLPAATKATLIGGEGHECEVNGVNYPYTTCDKFVRVHKGRKDLKPLPEEGLWRLELESPASAAKRLFVTVLTADDPAAAPSEASAELAGGRLVVKVGAERVEFPGIGGEIGASATDAHR